MTIETRISSFNAAFNRAMETLCVKINSSHFAAAQRRRALAGLDAHQLADIGLIFVDGDYQPHPRVVPWRPEAAQDRPKTKTALPPALPRGVVSP